MSHFLSVLRMSIETRRFPFALNTASALYRLCNLTYWVFTCFTGRLQFYRYIIVLAYSYLSLHSTFITFAYAVRTCLISYFIFSCHAHLWFVYLTLSFLFIIGYADVLGSKPEPAQLLCQCCYTINMTSYHV